MYIAAKHDQPTAQLSFDFHSPLVAFPTDAVASHV